MNNMKKIINQYRKSYESQFFEWLKNNDLDNPKDGFYQMEFDQEAAPSTTNRNQLIALGVLSKGEDITNDKLPDVIAVLNQIGVFVNTNKASIDHVVSVLNKAIDDEIPASWGYNQCMDVIDIPGE